MASPKKFGFIHITDSGLVAAESLCNWVIVIAAKVVSQGHGDLCQATVACAKVPTALALSAHDLLITHLTLPTKSQSQRRIAIPYAIQHELAMPAKDMHWSWRAKGQQLDLVGMSNSQITLINQTLQNLHFSPKWLIADGLHLNGHNAHWHLMALPDGWLLQQGQHSACCIANKTPLLWLDKAYEEAKNSATGAPLSMTVSGLASDDLNQWLSDSDIDTQTHEHVTQLNSASVLATNFDGKTCINLLIQNHRKMWTPSINWKLWRLPYTLTILLGLLGLSHLWIKNITTNQLIQTSYEQGVSVFQQTLPNERLVDPLTQLQSHVLAAQEPKQTAVFLPMLHAFVAFDRALNTTSQTSQTPKATNIKLITFADEQLQITLTTKPNTFNQWPKAGVLAGKFTYSTATQPSDTSDNSILITLSTQEAR